MWCSSTRCCTEAIGAEPALPSAEGTGGGGEVSASARHPSGGFVARLLQGAFSPPPAASNCPRSAGAHEEACGQGERDACASRVPQPHAQGGETPVGDVPLIDTGVVKVHQTERATTCTPAPANVCLRKQQGGPNGLCAQTNRCKPSPSSCVSILDTHARAPAAQCAAPRAAAHACAARLSLRSLWSPSV